MDNEKLGRIITPKFDQLKECVFDGDEFASHEFPPQTFLMEPWLVHPSYNLIWGARESGKTFLNIALALTVAQGGKMLDWQAREASKVLYVDGEMNRAEFQERLRIMSGGKSYKNLYVMSASEMVHCGHRAPSLAEPEWRTAFGKLIADLGVKMVVWDNISVLFRGIDINKGADWSEPNEYFIALRSLGITSIVVHHAGKDPERGPRGASNLEDAVDMSISLEKAWSETKECKFKMEWRKSRNIHSDTVDDITIKVADEGANSHFVYAVGNTETQGDIIALHLEGKRNHEIVQSLGCDKGHVSRTIRNYKNSIIT